MGTQVIAVRVGHVHIAAAVQEAVALHDALLVLGVLLVHDHHVGGLGGHVVLVGVQDMVLGVDHVVAVEVERGADAGLAVDIGLNGGKARALLDDADEGAGGVLMVAVGHAEDREDGLRLADDLGPLGGIVPAVHIGNVVVLLDLAVVVADQGAAALGNQDESVVVNVVVVGVLVSFMADRAEVRQNGQVGDGRFRVAADLAVGHLHHKVVGVQGVVDGHIVQDRGVLFRGHGPLGILQVLLLGVVDAHVFGPAHVAALQAQQNVGLGVGRQELGHIVRVHGQGLFEHHGVQRLGGQGRQLVLGGVQLVLGQERVLGLLREAAPAAEGFQVRKGQLGKVDALVLLGVGRLGKRVDLGRDALGVEAVARVSRDHLDELAGPGVLLLGQLGLGDARFHALRGHGVGGFVRLELFPLDDLGIQPDQLEQLVVPLFAGEEGFFPVRFQDRDQLLGAEGLHVRALEVVRQHDAPVRFGLFGLFRRFGFAALFRLSGFGRFRGGLSRRGFAGGLGVRDLADPVRGLSALLLGTRRGQRAEGLQGLLVHIRGVRFNHGQGRFAVIAHDGGVVQRVDGVLHPAVGIAVQGVVRDLGLDQVRRQLAVFRGGGLGQLAGLGVILAQEQFADRPAQVVAGEGVELRRAELVPLVVLVLLVPGVDRLVVGVDVLHVGVKAVFQVAVLLTCQHQRDLGHAGDETDGVLNRNAVGVVLVVKDVVGLLVDGVFPAVQVLVGTLLGIGDNQGGTHLIELGGTVGHRLVLLADGAVRQVHGVGFPDALLGAVRIQLRQLKGRRVDVEPHAELAVVEFIVAELAVAVLGEILRAGALQLLQHLVRLIALAHLRRVGIHHRLTAVEEPAEDAQARQDGQHQHRGNDAFDPFALLFHLASPPQLRRKTISR